jgi:hypothetical protein
MSTDSLRKYGRKQYSFRGLLQRRAYDLCFFGFLNFYLMLKIIQKTF